MKYHFIKNHRCSHCFQSFRLWQSPFLCASPPPLCTHKEPLPIQPLAFVKSVIKNHLQASCPYCCYETAQQTCPHCHEPLLKEYFKSDLQLISLVAPISEIAESYLEKLLFHIQKFGLGNWILSKMDADQQAILLTTKEGSHRLWIRFSISSFTDAIKADLDHSSQVFLFLEEKESADAFKFLQKLSKKQLQKSFAIIWPHLDKIINFLPKTNVFFHKNITPQDLQEIHLETSGFIGSYLGVNFLNYIQSHLRNPKFFSLSLEATSSAGWRVEDPLLWGLEKPPSRLKIKGLSLANK